MQAYNFKKTDPFYYYTICTRAVLIPTIVCKLIATPGAYACCFFTAMPNVYNTNVFIRGIVVNGLLSMTDKICLFNILVMLIAYILWINQRLAPEIQRFLHLK